MVGWLDGWVGGWLGVGGLDGFVCGLKGRQASGRASWRAVRQAGR